MTQQNVVIAPEKKAGADDKPMARVPDSLFSAVVQKPLVVPAGYITISKKQLLEINGGPRINSWVESMRASSPTHHKSTPSHSLDQSSWMDRHPSALEMLEQITNDDHSQTDGNMREDDQIDEHDTRTES